MSLSPGVARVLARVVLSVGGGLALATAFPTTGWWWMAPVGVGALTIAVAHRGWRDGFGWGVLFGLAFFLPSLSWAGTYVGPVPWVALAVLQSLYLGLAGALIAGPSRRLPLALLTPLGWVTSEALRARTPYGGFPWVRLAFSQADSPVVSVASLGGAPAVAAVVALTGGIVATLILGMSPVRGVLGLAPGEPPRPGRQVAYATAALACVLAPTLLPRPVDGPRVEVMGVQGNVPRAGLDFNAQRRQVLDNHAAATRAAAADVRAGRRPKPVLVVWPENSSDIDPVLNADAGAVIQQAVDDIGAPVLVGTLSEAPVDALFNITYLWLPQRGRVASYVKRHPVPFAEYIPSRDFFRNFSDAVDLVPRPYLAGHRVGTFDLPAGTPAGLHPGVLICFEVAYDDLARDAVGAGANLLVVQTNNATFGLTAESPQQLAISRVRAVEHGRSVLHVSTVGQSALITPDGRAHQGTELFTQAVLSGALPVRTTTSVADRVGEWPERVLIAAMIGCIVICMVIACRAPRRGVAGRRSDVPDNGSSDDEPADESSRAAPATGSDA